MLKNQKIDDKFARINKIINDGIILYGAGANGVWCLDYCRRTSIKVIRFIDSNPRLVGKVIEDIRVISYEDYEENYKEYPILISSKHHSKEIENEFIQNELMMAFDSWFICKNKAVYKKMIFEDDFSYRVLEKIQDCMYMSDETMLYDIAEGNQYFAIAPFFNTGNEYYVDLGGYVGDTLEKFFFAHNGAYNHIWIFEPGKEQLDALNVRLKRLKREWALEDTSISVVSGAVGNENGINYVSTPGNLLSMQVVDSGEKQISVYRLDDFFDRGESITFIKADIEGSEYEGLLGAEKIIREQKPKLALSVYHKPDDLLRVYSLLTKWNLGYKYALRHHSAMLMDTTLYCW